MNSKQERKHLKSFTVSALEDFPLVKPGDNITQMILETAHKNNIQIENGDIIAIAQKIVSKAENRIVNLKEVEPSKKAVELAKRTSKDAKFMELLLKETKRLLKVSKDILVVEDKRGLVCINAGIDKSNVKGKANYALLPETPDLSAEKCRSEIRQLTGKDVAVIVTDTYSRPFRRGQVNFAIGIAGINPFRDYRRTKDLFGLTLKVKNIAVVDEIAAAAELLMGQATEKTPVVMLKGLNNLVTTKEASRTSDLFISSKDDLFKNVLQ